MNSATGFQIYFIGLFSWIFIITPIIIKTGSKEEDFRDFIKGPFLGTSFLYPMYIIGFLIFWTFYGLNFIYDKIYDTNVTVKTRKRKRKKV